MQILGVPITSDDMSYSLSITGITTLTQSKYKSRHGGSKEICQVPDKGFQLLRVQKKLEESWHPDRKKSKRKKQSQDLTTKKRVTTPAYTINKREVTHRIRGYVNQMKGEKFLYFWTVTFPERTSDDSAYLLLNKWLTRLRSERMLKEYLWIAERQENKTIHFHMVVNNKMDVKKANKFMRAAIMYSIDNGEVPWSRTAAKNYNGIDIAKDRKTRRVTNFAKQKKQRSLANYLTKYVTKNNSTFQRLAWHSSRGYSNLITSVRITVSEWAKYKFKSRLDNENPLVTEYFTFQRWKTEPPKEFLKYLAFINQHIQAKFFN